jgi:hypothetical protein
VLVDFGYTAVRPGTSQPWAWLVEATVGLRVTQWCTRVCVGGRSFSRSGESLWPRVSGVEGRRQPGINATRVSDTTHRAHLARGYAPTDNAHAPPPHRSPRAGRRGGRPSLDWVRVCAGLPAPGPLTGMRSRSAARRVTRNDEKGESRRAFVRGRECTTHTHTSTELPLTARKKLPALAWKRMREMQEESVRGELGWREGAGQESGYGQRAKCYRSSA